MLLTGATGHVGGRLLQRLGATRPVRCLVRSEATLDEAEEVVVGDVLDRSSLASALEGIDVAVYLVHALGSDGDFMDEERRGAVGFAAEALTAGVGRIVYLGGLAHGDDLSDHLASRQEVGRILRTSGVPTVELRSSIVIGQGSASFELVRTLVDNAPALVLPDWVAAYCQPIAVDDVVEYLAAAVDLPVEESVVYEIGGADRVTYRELIETYAELTGKQLPVLQVTLPALPFTSDDVPSLLARLVPERARLWAKLIESLRFDSQTQSDRALADFDVRPRGLREAIEAALEVRADVR